MVRPGLVSNSDLSDEDFNEASDAFKKAESGRGNMVQLNDLDDDLDPDAPKLLDDDKGKDDDPDPDELDDNQDVVVKDPLDDVEWEGLNEDQKTKVLALVDENKKLVHANTSNNGRVSALQKGNNQLRRKLGEIKPTERPSKESVAERLETSSSELKDLRVKHAEEFPQTLELIDKALEVNNLQTALDVEERIEPLKQTADVLAEDRVTHGDAEVLDELESTWNVHKTVNSKEFGDWKKTRSPMLQEIIEKSEDPAEQLDVLNMFATGRDVSQFLVSSDSETKTEVEDGDDDAATIAAQEAEALKKKQLEDAGDLSGKAAAERDTTKPDDMDDAEASFKAVERQKNHVKQKSGTKRVEVF